MALSHHLFNILDGGTNGYVSSASTKFAVASFIYLDSHARKNFFSLDKISQRAVGKLDLEILTFTKIAL